MAFVLRGRKIKLKTSLSIGTMQCVGVRVVTGSLPLTCVHTFHNCAMQRLFGVQMDLFALDECGEDRLDVSQIV